MLFEDKVSGVGDLKSIKDKHILLEISHQLEINTFHSIYVSANPKPYKLVL